MSTRPLTERNLEIVRMWDADVPMAQIVRKFLLSHQRISKIVQRYGGKAKRSTWAPARAKIEAHRHEIEAAIAARCPMWRISARFKISMATLHDYGFRGLGHVGAPDRAAEWERLYVREGMSTPQIARRTGAPQSTIAKHLKKRGLTRDPQVAARTAYSDRRREALSQLCVRLSKEGVPEDEIARRCKTLSVEGVRAHLQRDADRRHWEDLYVTQNRTAAEISKLTGVGANTISVHIKHAGLSRPQGRRRVW